VVSAFIIDESCCQRVFKSYLQVGQKCRKLKFLLHKRGYKDIYMGTNTEMLYSGLILTLVTAIIHEHVESQVDKF
jgi:hypothetical protein